MWLHVDPASGVPIYLQIMEQIRSAAATGILQEGELLPSVRELAVKLAVNPNTVARAYRELQREGVITVERGMGTRISLRPPSLSPEEIASRLHNAAMRLAIEAYSLGASRRELMTALVKAADEVWPDTDDAGHDAGDTKADTD
ncbi:MAG TPA: GntR family transcriptional regulator [Firmicutes bacterium]|nr:GntR family transcriptional regulator [Bacillota bacterium]